MREKGAGVYPARRCPKCGLIYRTREVAEKLMADVEEGSG